MHATSNYPPKPKTSGFFPDKFPAIVVHKDSDSSKLVVLALGPVSGRPQLFSGVVLQPDPTTHAGYHSETWYKAFFVEAPDDIEIIIRK